MNESILSSIKKILGIDANYTAFDDDIIMHINAAFNTLNQLGVGPERGFMIEDKNDVWGDFLQEDLYLNSVKTYVALRVRLIFDPPATSFAISAMQDQIKEFEWRLNVHREETGWINPAPDFLDEYPVILDGGRP